MMQVTRVTPTRVTSKLRGDRCLQCICVAFGLICEETASGITLLLLLLHMVEQLKARYEGAFQLALLCLCWLASERQVIDAGKLCGSHRERQSKRRKESFISCKAQVQSKHGLQLQQISKLPLLLSC